MTSEQKKIGLIKNSKPYPFFMFLLLCGFIFESMGFVPIRVSIISNYLVCSELELK